MQQSEGECVTILSRQWCPQAPDKIVTVGRSVAEGLPLLGSQRPGTNQDHRSGDDGNAGNATSNTSSRCSTLATANKKNCISGFLVSNEKEISHGTVSWQTHSGYLAMGPLASSIG
jgi:hypothetical protein